MTDKIYDIIIIGGGLTGITAALSWHRLGLKIAIIDKKPLLSENNLPSDGRGFAISATSIHLLSHLEIWQHCQQYAQAINDIRVVDGSPYFGVSNLFLHFDHQDMGLEMPYGYIIEANRLFGALLTRINDHHDIDYFAQCEVQDMQYDIAHYHINCYKDSKNQDSKNITLTSRLLIGCDGKFGQTRINAGIDRLEWNYQRYCAVFPVTHTHDHQGVAVELFQPDGPFAMLPMQGKRMSIVWTMTPEYVQYMHDASQSAFNYALQQRFGCWLGDIYAPNKDDIIYYPLMFAHAKSVIAPRLALLGDAAHVIHPIAGQGLNVGLRDIAYLHDILKSALQEGKDIGSDHILQYYAQSRSVDTRMMAAFTDQLDRLFLSKNPFIKVGRNLGLATFNHMTTFKKLACNIAMGNKGSSKLPELLRPVAGSV